MTTPAAAAAAAATAASFFDVLPPTLVRSGLPSIDAFHHAGWRAGDTIEVAGSSGVGKTQLMMHALCTLLCAPGVARQSAVWIDCDDRFDVVRLGEMLAARLQHDDGVADDGDDGGGDSDENDDDNDNDNDNNDDMSTATATTPVERAHERRATLLADALRRVHVVRVCSTAQLLSTLDNLEPLLRTCAQRAPRDAGAGADDSADRVAPVTTVFVDSISAFYWQDRKRAVTIDALASVYARVVKQLRAVLVEHRLVLFAAKQCLLGATTASATSVPAANEFLGKQWHFFIKHRLMLHRPDALLGATAAAPSLASLASSSLSLPLVLTALRQATPLDRTASAGHDASSTSSTSTPAASNAHSLAVLDVHVAIGDAGLRELGRSDRRVL